MACSMYKLVKSTKEDNIYVNKLLNFEIIMKCVRNVLNM